jgi:hypothetical protein
MPEHDNLLMTGGCVSVDCSNNISVRLFVVDCLRPRVALEKRQPIDG